MARRRFFVDEVRRGEAELDGEEAEHLTRVLRAENGQQYGRSCGARLYLGEIVEARKRSVRFRIVEELAAPEPTLRIALLMSLIKFERFEWVVEKATELGVEKIVPVQAERSEHGLELAARRASVLAEDLARSGPGGLIPSCALAGDSAALHVARSALACRPRSGSIWRRRRVVRCCCKRQ